MSGFTGMTMNKAELIVAIQGLKAKEDTKSNIADTLEAFTKVISEELSQGNRVQLVGHGTYETADRAERTGRNPQTKELMTIPAKRVPVFKAGGNLKTAVKL